MDPGSRNRLVPVLAAVALAALGIAVRLLEIQVVRAGELRAQARRQHEQRIEIESPRGEIMDRMGRELAVSLESWSLYAHPSRIEDPVRAARLLAPVLGVSVDKLLDRLRADAPFVWIARRLDPVQRSAVRALDLPIGRGHAFDFEAEGKRLYPQGPLAVHVLGFANIDQRGVEGIELRFDERLHGDPTTYLAVRDGQGGMFLQQIRAASRLADDVILTLDMAIQHMVERELDRAMRETRARAASAIVLDPATGEVLALANRPTADPNQYGQSTPDQRRNRAVVEVYEPGSTFKVVAAAALLDAGAVVPSETIHCENGAFAFAGRRIRDHHPYGLLTFREVLEHSSNIGMVKAGGRLPHDSMHGYVSAFGFGRRTGIELPGEVSGLLAQAARWTPSTRASVSFGHEIGVTVLQMASAFAAVANDGELVPPRIVLGFRDATGTVHPAPSAEPRRVISSRTAAVLTELLEGVVERGTGKAAQIPGYRIAGKTGTAQKVIPKVGYSTTEHMASFAGYGPVRRPRIACLVVLDTPAGGVHTGGLTAAPVFARIVSEALAYLRVPPDEDVLIERRKRLEQEAAERRLKELARRRRQTRERPDHPPEETPEADAEPLVTGPGQAPDLRGMSLRDAIASLVRRGLRVSATGSGVVVEQNPPPGSSIADGQMCALRLAPEPRVRR